MPTNQSSSGNTAHGRTSTTSSTQTKSDQNVTAYARQAAETAVDVPVGTALRVADRVNERVKPFRTRTGAEREIRRVRSQFQRELSKVERRGGTARRRLTQRVKRQRNRIEREVSQRRRRVESVVRQNRRRAERQLRSARTQVNERVGTLV